MTSSGTPRWLALLGIVLALALPAVLMACGSDAPDADGERATATPRTEAASTPATEAAASTPMPGDAPTVTDAPRPTSTRPPLPTIGPTSAKTDRDALVALYNATNGENWEYSFNWLSDAPLGQWFSVITNDDGRVTGLELWANALSGEIPAELGSLANLEVLSLHNNELSGEIPAGLGSLANLRVLRLPHNALSGEIPAEFTIGQPRQPGSAEPPQQRVERGDTGVAGQPLQPERAVPPPQLDLNDLSGEIPAELGSLSNLKLLYLYGNDLSGGIPAELGRLSNLAHLELSLNGLSGEIPAWLGSLSNLTYLKLSANALSGEIPAELGSLSNLVTLHLWGNELSGEILAELGSLSNLTNLYLYGNDLSGEIPAELGSLSKLIRLYLNGNQLSGCVPSSLEDQLDFDYSDLAACPSAEATRPQQAETASGARLLAPDALREEKIGGHDNDECRNHEMACLAGHCPCAGAARSPHGLRLRCAGRRRRAGCDAPDGGCVHARDGSGSFHPHAGRRAHGHRCACTDGYDSAVRGLRLRKNGPGSTGCPLQRDGRRELEEQRQLAERMCSPWGVARRRH